ncbi:MAG TPA: SGNH/GDSL hydrolase family protein [Gemmataceae bacterium]
MVKSFSTSPPRQQGHPLLARRAGRGILSYLTVVVQLALILLTVHLFKIEPNLPFLAVMCLAAGGFLVHAWLPQRFRLAFFCLLSLASAVLLLGWTTAGWLFGLGGALIALCHLPVPWAYRVLLIAVTGAGLALWRTESTAAFWPILGSMFMFRLIVYLYDRRRERVRPPLLQTLAYFFTLPNLCFTLFPIIDFKTFRKTYYNDEPYTIYQSGVAWIVRGLVHLLAYRVIKYYLLPSPSRLPDLPHLLLFLGSNYALYLHVSGWFHIITGMLHLFGFNLPRTHHNYFLASSPSDVWRRINIYWKDFMAKVFFYPAFFSLRGWWGTPIALGAASLWVFVVTWLLHSYQTFWLRSVLPISFNEAFLWLLAGVVMAVDLQFDLSAIGGKQEGQKPSSETFSLFREALAGATLALRIMATFLMVSVFWACWTMPQFHSYLYVLATSGALATGVGVVLVWVAIGVAVGVLVRLTQRGMQNAECRMQNERQEWFSFCILHSAFRIGKAVLPVAVLLVLVAAGVPQVSVALGPRAAEVLATLRLETPTPAEAAVVVQGYYEQLADAHLQAAPLMAMPGLPEKKQPPLAYTDMTRPVDDFLERELIPGWSGVVIGHRLTINRLGMRDREGITREKPASVCRLAFVGSSVVMGYGVGDDEPFPRLLEKRLNAERPDRGRHIEVLNFGTGKSLAIHRRTLIERKVLRFDPDAIYYVAHQDEYEGTVRHLAMLVDRHKELPTYLGEIVQQAGIGPQTSSGQIEIRLQRFAPQIIRGTYLDIVQQCRQRKVLPVWIYLPMSAETKKTTVEPSELIGLAKEAGFVVLNMDQWDGDDRFLKLLRADRYHPNALGHQFIADRLEVLLHEQSDSLPACAVDKTKPRP